MHTPQSSQPPSLHLPFRPDIQGLRAVAILLVVFSHANLPGFFGGFIGVDIFFVLSGYLITGLILKEAQATNSINFLRFYSRRFKRLLPALLTVVFATLVLAYFILAPFEQVSQARSAWYVPLWLSNVYFSFSDFNYFAAEADSNLFLHTWSLAVEEQFYLLWPLLLYLLLFKTHDKSASGQFHTNDLRKGLIGIFLVSLVLGIYWSYTSPILAFYLMPGRGWQFAIGGIVFLLTQPGAAWPRAILKTRLYRYLGSVGIVLILVSLGTLNADITYPGFHALLPSVGAGLLLLAGSAETTGSLSRLLSNRWLQHIGDISYSWYLWHWPVLVLGGIVFPESTPGLTFFLIIGSLILAQATYWLVESPCRQLKLLTLRPALTVAASLVLMVFAALVTRGWESSAQANAESPAQIAYLQARNNLPVIYRNGCDEWYSSARLIECNFGTPGADRVAVLVGDSVGTQWVSALSRPFTDAGWRLIVYTKSSCPMVNVPFFYKRIGKVYEVCAEWRDNVLSEIEALQPELVFFGSSADYGFTEEQWLTGTQSVLSRIAPAAGNLFIIPGTYLLPFDAPACLARQQWHGEFLSGLYSCSAPVDATMASVSMPSLESAAADFPNVHMLDMNALVCPDDICSAAVDNIIVYRDSQHLSDQFVASQAGAFVRALQASANVEL